ncbi:hypothetical protein FRC98_08825 [Lujinxingia vulgaris]|uniref:Lipoprotein n=1 Tax=Lujinxingia vulgaris TaxID=2600176 RepID=A0A5C6XFX1_9DELT|nr:hypothetical protein [Lujinxingia vulgaris]TXD37777.1 hypothetical protein FRC98_08825 [Lujinxingia vulgaris]
MMILENRLSLPSSSAMGRAVFAALVGTMLGACSHASRAPEASSGPNASPPVPLPPAEASIDDAILVSWVDAPDALSPQARQELLGAECEQGDVQACIYAGALVENWESLRGYCAMGTHEACAILGSYAPYDATMANAHAMTGAHMLYRTLTLARPADAPGTLDTDVRQALYDATIHTDDPWIRRQMNFFGHRALLGRCQAALDRLEAEPGNQDAAAMAGNLCGYALDAMNATSVMVEDDAFTVAALAETSRIYGRLARAIDAMLPANAARASGEAADADERVAQYYENSDEAYARAAEVMKACGCGHWALIEDFVR